MVRQARLEAVASGLTPAEEGWFAVNARNAAWLVNEAFGARCVFEADTPVVRSQPGLDVHRFGQIGITLAVLRPGRPSGLYHAETAQEDFLVLAGECLAIVEGEERHLRAWDLLHCPPGTAHVFVGAGEAPCVLLMLGARGEGRQLRYPVEPAARARDAGVGEGTSSAREAYADRPHWALGRPEGWDALPWVAAGS
jgi:uncharacterized cupin superfamily protein